MSVEDRLHSRGERLRELALIEGDAPMGKLLRRFWQPVAMSKSVVAGEATAVRVFGEDLTLYRSPAGVPHLVGGHCAHRLTLLHTGWVDGHEIRCIYHGWTYDGTGQCTLRPAERDTARPNIKIAAYPLYEYGGLLFGYLGDGEPPPFELPRKPCWEGNGFHVTRRQAWPSNWLQFVENSMDAVHVSFVHAIGREQGRFIQHVSQTIPELEYFETDAGIRQIATRGPGNVRLSDWTFPNNNHIVSPGPRKGDPWTDSVTWHVPIDDEHTMRFAVTTMASTDPDTDRRFLEDRREGYNPADHYHELFEEHRMPEGIGSQQVIATQDYVALRGQGTIVDRSQERLGQSDAGVALLRRIFLRELEAIREGRPAKAWARLDEPAHLPIQVPEPV